MKAKNKDGKKQIHDTERSDIEFGAAMLKAMFEVHNVCDTHCFQWFHTTNTLQI